MSSEWSPTFVLLTCEHGGRRIPEAYAALFGEAEDSLASHLGLDIGALGVAQEMAVRLAAPLIVSTTTRLLIDLNRSAEHPGAFSPFTRDLPDATRRRILDEHYHPYRASVERVISAAVSAGHRVLHVGVHSCVDVLDGVVRDLDIGLLFDPARRGEAVVCDAWIAALRRTQGRCVFNEPYLGTDDGLTTHLRTLFSEESYAGVEVEVRQGLIGGGDEQVQMGAMLSDALVAALNAVN